MSLKSNSFVAAEEQVCLQPVLEHRQRRGRRNIAWQSIPHLCSSNRKGTTSDSWPTTGRNVKLFSGGGPEPASVRHVGNTCEWRLDKSGKALMHAALGWEDDVADIAVFLCLVQRQVRSLSVNATKTLVHASRRQWVWPHHMHQYYGSCTGCQSVSALCSRPRGSYISRLWERLPRTSQTTVAFCQTRVVAHCGSIPMTCGSCSCREHITNSVIGVSRPPVLDGGTTFHLDYGAGTYLRLLQTISENSFIWRPKRLVTLLNV